MVGMNKAPKARSDYWTTLPATFTRSKRLSEIAEVHGRPATFWGFTVLLCEATRQFYGVPLRARRETRAGCVELIWAEYAMWVGCDQDMGRSLIAAYRDVELIEVEVDHAAGFRARLVDWEQWHAAPIDPGAADRKAAQRRRDQAQIPVGLDLCAEARRYAEAVASSDCHT